MDNQAKYKKQWFDFIDYKPHPGQEKLHFPPNGDYNQENLDGVRFTVACCGRRFGKSHATAKELETYLTQPNKIVWVVGPSYNISEKIFRIIYHDMVVKAGYKPSKYSAKDQVLEFDWDQGKSGVYGKSCEHPSSMIGEGVDIMAIDEAAKIKNLSRIFEMYLRPCLSDKKGSCIMISTPDGFGYFWDLYNKGRQDKNWYSFNSPSWENYYAFPKAKEDDDLLEAQASLDKTVFDQEYGANFTSLQGKVYSDFSIDKNVGDYKYDPRLPVYIGMDFGYRAPAVIFAQVRYVKNIATQTNDPVFYIIDEIVHRYNLKTSELVEIIKSKGYKIAKVMGDPAGYQVAASVGVGEADIFYQLTGWRVMCRRDKSSRSIASGVSHVRSFIKASDGKRRFFVDRKCYGLIKDFESYRYPDTPDGKPIYDIPAKDGADHSMDAVRYLLVGHTPIKQFKLRTKYDIQSSKSAHYR